MQLSSKHDNAALTVMKKPIKLSYRIAMEDEMVQTKEGPVQAFKGDAILTGTQGENWPINKDKFAETYDVNDGVCSKKALPVSAFVIDSEFKVKASWGLLEGKANDLVVKYGDNDYGVVDRDIFNETYDVLEVDLDGKSALVIKAVKSGCLEY